MAMNAGSVSIADNGVETKSGLAEALYDELKAQLVSDLGDHQQSLPAGAEGAPLLRGLAKTANRFATALVTYIVANAKARVATTAAGLQRTPNPVNPDTDCQGPSADKLLGIE